MYAPGNVVRAKVGGVPDVAVPAGDGLVETELLHLLDYPVLARVQVQLGGGGGSLYTTHQFCYTLSLFYQGHF